MTTRLRNLQAALPLILVVISLLNANSPCLAHESRRAHSKPSSDNALLGRQSRLQQYLTRRYSLARINEYCRNDTRCIAISQSFKGKNLCYGKLYSDQLKKVGLISWKADLNPEKPSVFQLVIDRGGGHLWVIWDVVDFNRTNFDDQFEKELILKILANSMQAYQHASWLQHQKVPNVENQSVQAITNIKYDHRHRPLELIAILKDGKILRSSISRNWTLSNFTIDGKSEKQWTNVYENRDQNIAVILKSESEIYDNMKCVALPPP
ncbi:MAG: hypothetical protein JST01_01910 [Cyanobacteria bacterium SZAS TMP-1]|nr:hypothetical protein [Cyanobacteria bacterium SZAS TMP-1]